MSGFRRIVIEGAEWRWKTGKGGMVKARGPSGESLVFSQPDLGRSWDTFERGQHKRTGDGVITPGMVAEAIRRSTSQDDRSGGRRR